MSYPDETMPLARDLAEEIVPWLRKYLDTLA